MNMAQSKRKKRTNIHIIFIRCCRVNQSIYLQYSLVLISLQFGCWFGRLLGADIPRDIFKYVSAIILATLRPG